MATFALVLSIVGLLSSFFLFGIIPALGGVVFGGLSMARKFTRTALIAVILGLIGIVLPVIFYLNTYGFVSPVAVLSGTASPLETPMFFATGAEADPESGVAGEDLPLSGIVELAADGLGEVIDAATFQTELPEELTQRSTYQYDDAYAHCYDYIYVNNAGHNISASFTYKALNANGEVIATVIDTISGIPAGQVFATEAVFNKNLGEIDEVVFEAQVRECGDAVYATDRISVTHEKTANGERIQVFNRADFEVRVNVHVLFFDGKDLVQNSWIVPSNTASFTVAPATTASSEAVCRAEGYSRVQLYYSAMRAETE